MNIIFFIFFFSHMSFASLFSYVEEITKLPDPEARILTKEVKFQSKKLRVLDCSLELIERQWGGSESVQKGIEYLLEFLKESTQADPDYITIQDMCLDSLDDFNLREKQNLIHSKALSNQEIEQLKLILIQENSELADIIISSFNQETLCHTSWTSASASIFLGMSLGKLRMDCFTPLGRRFKLVGPSIGLGLGIIGATLTLPNSSRLHNPLTHTIKLFERSPSKFWLLSNRSSTFARGVGMTIIEDRSNIYKKDIRTALGLNIYSEITSQILREIKQPSFYLKLVQTKLFEDMSETAL